MLIPKNIFRAYDIRGLAGDEITSELAKKIAIAFVQLREKELGVRGISVVVGRDMRESSFEYQNAVMDGLVESGARVFDVGLVSTPAFYFSVGHLNADGGIMVTASHNPSAYNGFKLTRENAKSLGGDTGIFEIADIIERDVEQFDNVVSGQIEVVNEMARLSALEEVKFEGDNAIKRFKIVCDSANGMGAQYLDEMFKIIDADVIRMNWEFDGTFPNHEADPVKDENTSELRARVVKDGADLGIATDGDGDRIFFIDEKGHTVNPAVLRGLLAQIVLRSNPGATICYDVRPGKITTDMIVEAGGVPSMTRVGHSLIKEQMLKVGAPFGGESSGHFFYRFARGTYEGPVTVATQLLQELTREGKTLSQLIEPLDSRYSHSGEINFAVEDKLGTITRIKQAYADGELNELDGLSITYDDFWFNVRASNTESKLRLNLEAVDRATMERRRDEIIGIINN